MFRGFWATAILASFLLGTAVTAQQAPQLYARHDYPITTDYLGARDTNGDRIPDLIALSAHSIAVLFGDGSGNFTPGPLSPIDMQAGVELAVADLNGDGRADAVVIGGLNDSRPPWGISVCFGNGDGTFQSGVFYQAGEDTNIRTFTVGDFNGDGNSRSSGDRRERNMVIRGDGKR